MESCQHKLHILDSGDIKGGELIYVLSEHGLVRYYGWIKIKLFWFITKTFNVDKTYHVVGDDLISENFLKYIEKSPRSPKEIGPIVLWPNAAITDEKVHCRIQIPYGEGLCAIGCEDKLIRILSLKLDISINGRSFLLEAREDD